MIKKIELLRNFGIFQNYTPPTGLTDFSRYNLVYGWNGCGKSTMSKLFASLEHKKIDEELKDCQFKIITTDGEISESNLVSNTSNVRVFNQDFIKANIKWEEGVKSILLIAEDKIEDRKKLDLLKAELGSLELKILGLEDDNKTLYQKIDNFFSGSAKIIKESFKIIDTSDKYYFNYDKRKFEKFVQDNLDKILDKTSILSDKAKTDLTTASKPVKKEEIFLELKEIDLLVFRIEKDKIKAVLERNITASTISRLLEHPVINLWVQRGLEIHGEFKSDRCEFCNQKLPADRLEELSKHFNKAYTDMVQETESAIQWVNDYLEKQVVLPDMSNFYEEFHERYQLHKSVYMSGNQEFRTILEKWRVQLEKKRKNPFGQLFILEDNLEACCNKYNHSIKDLLELGTEHNAKTKNFEETIKENKRKLELHYAAELIQESSLKEDREKLATNDQTVSTTIKSIEDLNKSIQKITASLINEEKGADHFNKYLHGFLGRTDISLKFNQKEKGYQILRGKKTTPAKNLSEGEKTAIAFVYFVIKLTEQGNDITKTIVVVDDPISSFDSNCLFHSFSFLKNNCRDAEQLFVFTHSFQYYRLIRDWFSSTNIKRKKESSFFTLESTSGEDRTASLMNANDALQKYNSEYHYVFSRLNRMVEDDLNDLDKIYLTGNLCRKLLEGFLYFKFPKSRPNFRELMDECCEDKNLKEKIYKFVQNYSHNQLVEFHDTPVDNLMAEGKGIVKDVFHLMQTLDARHFEEMLEICN